MQRDFAKLRQALQDPADGPYALTRMRELLVGVLVDWPDDAYKVADLFLPWSGRISQRSRDDIAWLMHAMEVTPWIKEVGVFNFCQEYKLITFNTDAKSPAVGWALVLP
jgi:hypothetical protein